MLTMEQVIDLIHNMLYTVLLLAGPLLGLGLLTGLIVAIFQAVTQIHEMTLTFVPKILTVAFVLFFLFPWMANILIDFTREVFSNVILSVR